MADLPVNRTEVSTVQEHEDDHNALHAFHNLIDTAGDLIVGTGVDTAGRLAKGAALEVLRVNAGATALEWAAQSGTNALLATKVFVHSGTYSTASGTDADVDATNMAVAFTAPASGNVLVRLTALANSSSNAGYMWWSVREGAAAVAGPFKMTANPDTQMVTAVFSITGLSAGAHTYKWGYRIDSGVTGSIFSQASFSAPPAVIEVWAAP